MLKNKIYFKLLSKSDSNTRQLKNLLRYTTNAKPALESQLNAVQSTVMKDIHPAMSYGEIPSVSSLKLIKNLLPGGKYYKLDVTKFFLALKHDLGIIYKLPGAFGQTDLVVTHNVQDFETLFRNEGIWPKRPGMEAIGYHRSVFRADFFQGTEGLTATQGEKWSKFRSAVNPVLMQPKAVRLYLRKMSNVNMEFLQR